MTYLDNVIIGNGLIAKCFSNIDFGRPVLLLASGVSNSQETSLSAFRREVDLVEHAINSHPGLHVLYFSTCSVESGVRSPYVMHKLAMEQQVLSMSASCHIFRLPQVVGLVRNKTLVSFFVESVLKNRVLKIQSHAKRSLLDVRDVARVTSLAVRQNFGTRLPLNIVSSNQVSVIAIVGEIARLLNRSVQIESVDGGYSQPLDISYVQQFLKADDPLFSPDYWLVVLRYYVPLMAVNYENSWSSL